MISSKSVLISLLIFLITPLVYAQSTVCKDWFRASKINPVVSGCELKCSSLATDMSTFDCASYCSKLCVNDCVVLKQFWKNKINNLTPKNWPRKNNKSKKFSHLEELQVLNALSQLPISLWDKSKLNIHRMEKSDDYPNPAEYRSPDSIVLFDTAFSSSSISRILAHELLHDFYERLSAESKEGYKLATNWFEVDPSTGLTIRRSDGFVKDDGKLNPEEDFANNLEFYLFENARLKSVTPKAYDWIKKQFSDTFILRKSCDFK